MQKVLLQTVPHFKDQHDVMSDHLKLNVAAVPVIKLSLLVGMVFYEKGTFKDYV